MTFSFMPASEFRERAGLFISLTGGTNSGKTFSAMRLARGIAGPEGKIAVLDTEAGRTLHLKDDFRFDITLMEPPFRPSRFSEAAAAAERAGYDVLVIDSFSMEWAGPGGVLSWQEDEAEAAFTRAMENRNDSRPEYKKREAARAGSWNKPKSAHKSMVYDLLQRRIPIVFSVRGQETFVPPNTKLFKSITDKQFPFEVTVSFRLETERKGYIDLKDASTFKLEAFHRPFFKDGDRISEDHGRLLAEWARGGVKTTAPAVDAFLLADGDEHAARGTVPLRYWWGQRTPAEKKAVGGAEKLTAWKAIAELADAAFAADDLPFDEGSAEPNREDSKPADEAQGVA